jgi:2-polyprenyl-6-methoxyphenol hydroxylase-like FAD-dependent oxidoreductase
VKKIVVVGAGLNGLTLAEILLNKGYEVILIENGNENFKNFSPNEFINSGLNHVGIKIGRCKGIGGTTNLWGGQLVKFVKSDFENNNFYYYIH